MVAKPALTSLVPREAIADCDRRDAASGQIANPIPTHPKHGRVDSLDPADAELLKKAAGGIRIRDRRLLG